MKTMNARPLISWLTVGLSALALSGCGGGEQVEKFRPSNIVSFGDESSAFAQEAVTGGEIKGLKYSVNALAIGRNASQDLKLALVPVPAPPDPSASGLQPIANQSAWLDTVFVDGGSFTWASGFPQNITRVLNLDTRYDTPTIPIKADVTYQYVYDCNNNRLWIQILANSFGKSFSTDCPYFDDRGGARTYAKPEAKATDIPQQIDTALSDKTAINGNTLVTLLVGQNDVLEQYQALFPSPSATPTNDQINSAVETLLGRGRSLVDSYKRIIDTGARLLFVEVPDLSFSPRVGNDSVRAAVMVRLVQAFNEGVMLEMTNRGLDLKGRQLGRVKAFDLIRNMALNPSSYGLINNKDAVCDTAALRSIDTSAQKAKQDKSSDLKYCNGFTLVSGATAYTYLWALDTWLTPRAHEILAGAAFSRADNDTF